jgi:prepilin-type N-terminal cleavage/methylation domain-containing protein
VARNAALDAEELERDRGLPRAHRVPVADRQDREVRSVDPSDQLHVAEDAGIAGVVEAKAVLELEHEPCRLARVRAVRGRARVRRVGERESHAVDLGAAPLVHAARGGLRKALLLQPIRELDHGDQPWLEALAELHGIGDVVEVGVRESHDVDSLGALLALGAPWVPEPRVDVDPLAAWGVDAKRRMPEPGEGHVRHAISSQVLRGPADVVRTGTLGASVNRVWSRIDGFAAGPRRNGFTLIEILLVLIVIAVLLAIAIPSILSYRNRAGDAVAKADVRVAIPAINAYYGDSSTYVGMTLAVLRARYDQSLSGSLSFSGQTDSTYCVQSTVSGRTWRQNGPAAPIEQASC